MTEFGVRLQAASERRPGATSRPAGAYRPASPLLQSRWSADPRFRPNSPRGREFSALGRRLAGRRKGEVGVRRRRAWRGDRWRGGGADKIAKAEIQSGDAPRAGRSFLGRARPATEISSPLIPTGKPVRYWLHPVDGEGARPASLRGRDAGHAGRTAHRFSSRLTALPHSRRKPNAPPSPHIKLAPTGDEIAIACARPAAIAAIRRWRLARFQSGAFPAP